MAFPARRDCCDLEESDEQEGLEDSSGPPMVCNPTRSLLLDVILGSPVSSIMVKIETPVKIVWRMRRSSQEKNDI